MYFCPLANSADLDKMPPYAAFHLGLHCLQKYLITGIQNMFAKVQVSGIQNEKDL